MKNVVFGLILLSGLISRAGCGGPSLYTSLKIKYTTIIPAYNNDQIDTVIGIHPFEVKILPNGHCQDFEDLQVFRDDSLLLSVAAWQGARQFHLYSFSGHYRIKCCWKYSGMCFGFSWEFDLVYIPIQVDTASIASIPPLKNSNPNFLVYPNPTSGDLHLKNESSPIQSIHLFDLNGKLITTQNINSTEFVLPIEHFPCGLYLLQVATQSEKKILRRIVKN